MTVRTVASLSDIGDSCVTVSCVSTPMTVARRAGARWGESSRPSAPLSARAKHASRLVCGRVQKSPTPASPRTPRPRAVRSRSHKPVETPPEDHRRPGRPGATGRGPPHERSAPTPPVASAAVRIATNSRDRAGVGLSFELARRSGHADAPAVAACGACSVGPRRARAGRTGARPACQVRANTARTPRHPRTRRRCAYARPTTAAIGYPRLCGYDYEAAMATWIEATTRRLAARRSSAPARRARGATRRYDVL